MDFNIERIAQRVDEAKSAAGHGLREEETLRVGDLVPLVEKLRRGEELVRRRSHLGKAVRSGVEDLDAQRGSSWIVHDPYGEGC